MKTRFIQYYWILGLMCFGFLPKTNAQTVNHFEYWFNDHFSSRTLIALANVNSDGNILDSVDISGLPEGLHTIHFRFGTTNDTLWSSVSSFLLYRTVASNNDPISMAQYWFDDDFNGANQIAVSATIQNEGFLLESDLNIDTLSAQGCDSIIRVVALRYVPHLTVAFDTTPTCTARNTGTALLRLNRPSNQVQIRWSRGDTTLNISQLGMGTSAASRSLDAVITTQLDTFEALQAQLKKVVKSLRDEDLESNLLKINLLPKESQDLIPYFKALMYLKHGEWTAAKELLNAIGQQPHHPKYKEAMSLLEGMK